jgi:transposase-like protein
LDEDRQVPAEWATGSLRRAARARIVLACAEPEAANSGGAEALGLTRVTVAEWWRRFAESGLAGLDERPSLAGRRLDWPLRMPSGTNWAAGCSCNTTAAATPTTAAAVGVAPFAQRGSACQ